MSSERNAETMARFYAAFAKRDWAEMGACYSDEATFADPVFPDLDAAEARTMWRMLCERGTDLVVSMSDPWTEGELGGCRWDAHYTFSATGRKVHNRIQASFRFRDGLFVEHRDQFDFWRWSRQALGPVGWLLGWTPLVRKKVRSQAGRQLDRAKAGAPAE